MRQIKPPIIAQGVPGEKEPTLPQDGAGLRGWEQWPAASRSNQPGRRDRQTQHSNTTHTRILAEALWPSPFGYF